jgi:DNA-binding transcriptional MocR family regulator
LHVFICMGHKPSNEYLEDYTIGKPSTPPCAKSTDHGTYLVRAYLLRKTAQAWPKAFRMPPQQALAKHFGAKQAGVCRSLKVLIEQGWITSEDVGQGRGMYKLLFASHPCPEVATAAIIARIKASKDQSTHNEKKR